MSLFTVYQDQMKSIKLYKVYCIKCHKQVYSKEEEMRYDFIKRLQKEGWVISMNDPSGSPVFCPECKCEEDIIRNNKIDRGVK